MVTVSGFGRDEMKRVQLFRVCERKCMRVRSPRALQPRMLGSEKQSRTGERGSSLILALVYLIVGSLIVTALASWTSNDLHSVKNFQDSEATLYDANGVAQLAIQYARYTNLPSGPVPCSGASPVVINGNTVAMIAFCSEQTGTSFSRVVTVDVYADPVNSGIVVTQVPSSAPLLVAVVGFNDNEALTGSGAYTCSSSVPSDCGLTMDVLSWKVQQ